jgi:hypothetical protein
VSARDPGAFDRLAKALSPAAQRVHDAHVGRRRSLCVDLAVRSVPRISLWILVLSVAAGFLFAVPFWLPPLGALALVLVVFAVARSRIAAVASGLGDGAIACDRANDNQDRLSAACELAAATPSADGIGEALARAAVEDGVQSLARIDTARLALPEVTATRGWLTAVLCMLAIAVLPGLLPRPGATLPTDLPRAGAGRAPGNSGEPQKRAEVGVEPVVTEPAAAKREEPKSERKDSGAKPGTPPPPKPSAPVPAVPAASGLGQSGSDAAGDSSQNGAPKAAPAGNPGSGQSGGGQGSSAGGAPDPVPTPPSTKAPSKPKKPQSPKETPQQDSKSSESAGAPSGQSRGSGRMSAVGNKRSDQNRGQEREDDPEIEDEPVEDETDEQEQRGGVMPMRRGDNRAAARELSISGDGPPDQGRGGPTPPKKSRGTASLVLGLRLPDSVRGQPNPGTAKTTLEQIPPRPSAGELGLARVVTGSRPTTPQSQRSPTPFLSLQQAYSALLRARDSAPISGSAPISNPATTPADSPKDPR